SLTVKRAGGTHVIFSSADIPGEVVDVLALDAHVLARRPALQAALVRVWGRILADAAAHADDAHAIVAAREHVSVPELRAALEHVHLVTVDEQAAYTGPDGKLAHVTETVESALRASGQLDGPKRSDGIIPVRGTQS